MSREKDRKKTDFNVCSSDAGCPATKKCVDGKCEDVCPSPTCSDETPTCIAQKHSAVCQCTKTSCGAGKECVDGECVPCADNASCDNPCPEGSYPNGSGCGTVVCMSDDDCEAGKRCENGGTANAECVTCRENEQCNCPDGYVVNSAGVCVKPACTDNSDCSKGNKCVNAGKANAECTPCSKGETCSCTDGTVADGNGGCEETNDDDPCISYGYYPYASDTMTKYCAKLGSEYHPNPVTVNGRQCHECIKGGSTGGDNTGGSGGNSGSSCTKKSPSSSGRYTAGQSFCYFISSEARNAWTASGGCASHLYCSTVRAAYHGNNGNCTPWVQISAEGYMGGQGEDCH